VIRPLPPIPQKPSQVTEVNPQYARPKEQEANIGKSNELSLNHFSDWVTNNKKGLMFGLGGVVIILILVVAIKYVIGVDFSKNNSDTNLPNANNGSNNPSNVAVAKANNTASINNNYYVNGTFTGAWFKVTVPPDFIAKPSMKSNSGNGYESAFFDSPDGDVEFYIFSPQWGGDPTDIGVDQNIEKINSTTTQKSRNKITTWSEISAIDGSYLRAYQDTKSQNGSNHWVIGLKYKSQMAYDKYKQAYLAFKKSLVQFSD
jgi:hypothetical protein